MRGPQSLSAVGLLTITAATFLFCAETWAQSGASSVVAADGTREFSIVFNGIAAIGMIGGIFSIWLGYKLFANGIGKGRGELQAEVKFVKILFSGVGPGLFFMAFGALVLITGMVVVAL